MFSDKFNGCNPLHFACIYGYDSLIEPFLNFWADINSINHGGDTPLHKASKRDYEHKSIPFKYPKITQLLQTYDNYLKINTALKRQSLSTAKKMKI